MKHMLIVDDEMGSRESLRAVFSRTYKISVARNAEEAQQALSQTRADIVLLDVMMPGKDGLALLKDIQSLYPELPVIMVSASTSVQPVVQAIKVGACDFVTKPFDVDQIRLTVARALQNSALQRNVEVLKTEVSSEYPTERIVGEAASFRQALDHAQKAAETDSTVLIYGETGTGKELVARSIHAWSSRREEPFVAVHCAALPEALMESELFGHEKGAFTSADRQKPGRFDLAGPGTIFFDEVSEMSLSTQVKLLRVLQEKEFMRVGGTRVIRTEARVIAATGRDLKEEIREKRFRDDLFYRLSVVPIRLPPLRERPGDIALLANHFFQLFRRRIGVRTQTIAAATMQGLCGYPWPGNIPEVRNILERLLVLPGTCEQLLPEHLPEEFHAGARAAPAAGLPPGATLLDAVRNYEREIITQAMQASNGVQTAAARRLGTTRRILKYRMRQMNLPDGDALAQ
jgi:DNA-binding NtrC family response regulator